VILTKAGNQNRKQKAGKQMLEDIKRNSTQADVIKTAPRTDEQELESCRKREERMQRRTAPAPHSNTKLAGCQGDPPPSQAPFPSISHMLGGVISSCL